MSFALGAAVRVLLRVLLRVLVGHGRGELFLAFALAAGEAVADRVVPLSAVCALAGIRRLPTPLSCGAAGVVAAPPADGEVLSAVAGLVVPEGEDDGETLVLGVGVGVVAGVGVDVGVAVGGWIDAPADGGAADWYRGRHPGLADALAAVEPAGREALPSVVLRPLALGRGECEPPEPCRPRELEPAGKMDVGLSSATYTPAPSTKTATLIAASGRSQLRRPDPAPGAVTGPNRSQTSRSTSRAWPPTAGMMISARMTSVAHAASSQATSSGRGGLNLA